MIRKINKNNAHKYYIVYSNDLSIFSFGKLDPNQQLETGQPNLKTFPNERSLKARVDALKGQGYFDSIKDVTPIDSEVDPPQDVV